MNPSDHTRFEGPKNAFSSEAPRGSGNDRSLSPGWVLPKHMIRLLLALL